MDECFCMYVKLYLKTLAMSADCWFPQRASNILTIYNIKKQEVICTHILLDNSGVTNKRLTNSYHSFQLYYEIF